MFRAQKHLLNRVRRYHSSQIVWRFIYRVGKNECGG